MSKKNNESLLNMTTGQLLATVKRLEEVGLTIPGCKVIRQNDEAAQAMVEALQPFLLPINLHPDRHYDLSAALGLADPLENIQWPEVELAENQFLVAYRGESPHQVFDGMAEKDVYVWEGLRKLQWFKEGLDPCIALVTLPVTDSENQNLKQQTALCQQGKGQMTPFVINAMIRLAHKRYTGDKAGGWMRCPETTSSGRSAYLYWHGSQLCCNGSWVGHCVPRLRASSLEVLSSLEL